MKSMFLIFIYIFLSITGIAQAYKPGSKVEILYGNDMDTFRNTLRLNFDNGQKQVANILIWNMGDGKKYLVINTTSFPQEK